MRHLAPEHLAPGDVVRRAPAWTWRRVEEATQLPADRSRPGWLVWFTDGTIAAAEHGDVFEVQSR